MKSPSDRAFETFDGKNNERSRIESSNARDNEILNHVLENHNNSNKIFSSWRRQNPSVGSKFCYF
jgi:hypothetical protein